jgi:P27 family predicted phage terminase small subunit
MEGDETMKTSTTQTEVYQVPEHLSEKGKKLWCDIVPRRAKSPERLALLLAALEAMDRADSCRELIQHQGLTVTSDTTGIIHVHPLIRVEKEARTLFAKIWSDLSLTWDMNVDGRI